jgi:hypothetical protein
MLWIKIFINSMLSYDPLTKRLGSYLIDAGLLTEFQVDVALNDQEATGMRFGDIIVERGWVKRQTIEYLTRKIISMERELGEPLKTGLLQTKYSKHKSKNRQ